MDDRVWRETATPPYWKGDSMGMLYSIPMATDVTVAGMTPVLSAWCIDSSAYDLKR